MSRGSHPPALPWRPSGVPVPPRPPATWWLPVVLVAVTEVELRRRPVDRTAAGVVDPTVALELGTYAAVALYLAVRWRGGVRRHVVTVASVGACLTLAATAAYAPHPGLAAARASQLVVVVALTLQFGVDAGDRVDHARRFAHALVVYAVALVAVGAAWVAPRWGVQRGRFTWLHTHSVVAGATLAVVTVLLAAMWLAHPVAQLPWRRWVYGVLVAVVGVALVCTRTRGSIGAAAAGVAVVAMLWPRGRGRRDLLLLGASIAPVVALTVAAPLSAYLLRGSTGAELASLNRRTDLWAVAVEIVLARPVQGLGLTASRTAFADAVGVGGAHNAYLNVAVDAGLVGLAWWLALLGVVGASIAGARRVTSRLGVAARATDGRGAQRLDFDTVALAGVMVCQLVNGITAEWLGAPPSLAVVVLLLSGQWSLACTDELERAGA